MEFYKLRRKAIVYDCVCIAIAMVVLFLANRQLLPMWALIVGVLLAAAFMFASIWCLLRARKLLREMEPSAPSRDEAAEAQDIVSPE